MIYIRGNEEPVLPQSRAVHLAAVAQMLAARPAYFGGAPLPIDAGLWQAAHDELRQVMSDRGFPLPTDPGRKVPHFLFLGTPIVPVAH